MNSSDRRFPLGGVAASLVFCFCGAPPRPPATLPAPVVQTIQAGRPAQPGTAGWTFPPTLGQVGCRPDAPLTWQPPAPQPALAPLRRAVDEALQAAGHHPTDASPTGAAELDGLATWRHVTMPAEDGATVTHWILEVVTPWSPEHTARVLPWLTALPAAPPRPTEGWPCFSYVGPTPPAAAAWALSNSWYGWLESALDADRRAATDPLRPAGDAWAGWGRARLAQLGLTVDDAGLDALLGALPRATTPGGFRPEATLAAVGALLGEQVRRESPSLIWDWSDLPGLDWPVLRDPQCGGLLRPIDFAIEAWAARPRPVSRRYVEWSLRRVHECQHPPPDQPDPAQSR